MPTTDSEWDREITRMLSIYQRGIITSEEAGKKVISALVETKPGAQPVDSWQLRVVLASVLKPDWVYRSIAYLLPALIPPTEASVQVGDGWLVDHEVEPLAAWLATTVLIPPEGDMLLGLASILLSVPPGMEAKLGQSNEIELRLEPHLTIDSGTQQSPSIEVLAEPGRNGIRVMAHTVPLLQETVRMFTQPVEPVGRDAAVAAATERILNNSLDSMRQVLIHRRAWRNKHPSWGQMPPNLLSVLRCAPKHSERSRGWTAEELGIDGLTNAVEAVCDEIEQLEPALPGRTTPVEPDVRERDARVIRVIERWSEDVLLKWTDEFGH